MKTQEHVQLDNLSHEEKLLRGTAWLTFANFMSRLLGAFYIIPWYDWMGKFGDKANALFGMGYNVYAIFLVLSTTGLNTAVSKQIAKYKTLDQEEEGLGLAVQFFLLMLVSGGVFALVLYLGAPLFSSWSGADETLVPVLRSLTLAVLVFPAMSVLRGIFQGYNTVKPNAFSQLAEQLIRVIWMLVTTFFIMKMGSKNYVAAVTQSTFAAFVGMLASLAVLGYYLWKEGLLGKLLHLSRQMVFSTQRLKLVKETVRSAVPLIVVGIAVQAYQLIDQVSFIHIMSFFTGESKERLSVVYAYLSANPNKIIMLIVAVAIAIGDVGIPLLTEKYHKGDKPGVARLMLNGFQMLLVFALPAVVGAILLAEPLYVFFYGPSENLALGLFILTLMQTMIQCCYFAIFPMLYAVDEIGSAVRYVGLGFLVKLLAQVPLIWLFKAYGPVLSTGLALLVSLWLMYRHLQLVTRFNPRVLVRSSLRIGWNTLAMAVPVLLVVLFWGKVLPPTNRWTSLLFLVTGASLGGLVYTYFSLKTRTLDKLIGARADGLRRLFRII